MNQYLVVGVVFLVVIALLATNKKLVETLKNIYKIEELRKRVIYTIGLLLVYRLGSFVVIPGINPNALGEGSAYASQLEGNGLLGLLDVFSGGAFGNAAIFALGVMPYITASIIIQLMGMMVPYFQKMQKEGESGRRKMNQWTRFLTIGVLLLQEGTNRRKVLGQALLAPCTGLGAAVHEEAVIGLVGAEADVIGDHGIDGAALCGVCVMLRRQRHIAQPVVIDENIRHISAHQQHNSQQDTQRDLQPFFHTYVPPSVYNFSSA